MAKVASPPRGDTLLSVHWSEQQGVRGPDPSPPLSCPMGSMRNVKNLMRIFCRGGLGSRWWRTRPKPPEPTPLGLCVCVTDRLDSTPPPYPSKSSPDVQQSQEQSMAKVTSPPRGVAPGYFYQRVRFCETDSTKVASGKAHTRPRDCYDIMQTNASSCDGAYTVYVGRVPYSPCEEISVEVYCDMTTDGGGWTVCNETRFSTYKLYRAVPFISTMNNNKKYTWNGRRLRC